MFFTTLYNFKLDNLIVDFDFQNEKKIVQLH